MTKPIVWVVHPVKEDISSAQRWGTLKFINNSGYVYPDQLERGNGEEWHLPMELRSKIRDFVINFNANGDALLIVGDQLQIAAAVAALGGAHRAFTVLRYDRQAAGYIPVTL